MHTLRLSATAARNKFFELLNQVAQGTHVIIEKDNKEIAILSPRTTKTDWKYLHKAVKNAKGILRNYSPEEIAPASAEKQWSHIKDWSRDLQVNDK